MAFPLEAITLISSLNNLLLQEMEQLNDDTERLVFEKYTIISDHLQQVWYRTVDNTFSYKPMEIKILEM